MTLVLEHQEIFGFSHSERTVGFTGTQLGMNGWQFDRLMAVFSEYDFQIARHGDCVGADAQFDEIAHLHELCIHVHPCNLLNKRAWTKNYTVEHAPKDPLDRNRDIVSLSDCLLATPSTTEEQLRSGTWATIRYARKLRKPYLILFPDGSTDGSLDGL